ncbi:MAG: C-GCAxxG-C-C family (seleno)protein [Peptostreptococcaceae bacterium]
MENIVVDLEKIRTDAEDYYKRGDFYCSEAIVKVIKDTLDLDISDEIISMASGFPVGIGGAGCTCGAVSGGVMMIGLLFGRTNPKDSKVAKAMELSKELHQVFKTKNKTLCCKALTRGMVMGEEVHMKQCVYFTGDIAYETTKIICRELEIETI